MQYPQIQWLGMSGLGMRKPARMLICWPGSRPAGKVIGHEGGPAAVSLAPDGLHDIEGADRVEAAGGLVEEEQGAVGGESSEMRRPVTSSRWRSVRISYDSPVSSESDDSSMKNSDADFFSMFFLLRSR